MSFSFNIFSAGGGGGGSGNGISKYATAASLPVTAADGDVGIVLDTNNLYSYDTGVGGWVIIGGPGVAVTVSDTDSIDLVFALNDITANLRIPGYTTIPSGMHGPTLQIYAGASPGLVALLPGNTVQEVTSSVLQFFGSTFGILGTTLGIRVNPASGSTPGYLSAADYARFAGGISALLNTQFPIFGGGLLSSGLTLSVPVANGSTGGYLSATDWTTFNNKLSVGATIGQLGNIAANTFLGNNTGGAGPILALTIAQAKVALGISGTNLGDVTLGAFLAATSAVGATISAAQVLSFTEADQTFPGMMSPNQQTFNGQKFFNALVVGWSGFGIPKPGGPETVYLNSPAGLTQSVNYFLPPYHGYTNSQLSNLGGDGILTWTSRGTIGGDWLTVSAANGTATLATRFIGVTTTTSDRSVGIDFLAGITGVVVTVQKLDSGLGNVLVGATQGINGASIMILSGQWSKMQFVATGSGFYA